MLVLIHDLSLDNGSVFQEEDGNILGGQGCCHKKDYRKKYEFFDHLNGVVKSGNLNRWNDLGNREENKKVQL
ncbi:MAG TPA: hypothetical protein EYO80_08870 [Candidatus Marinimicrobia bacterium]|nr:hypothetical protein [Candidatus Neomarinimicrobiota bacterium]